MAENRNNEKKRNVKKKKKKAKKRNEKKKERATGVKGRRDRGLRGSRVRMRAEEHKFKKE